MRTTVFTQFRSVLSASVFSAALLIVALVSVRAAEPARSKATNAPPRLGSPSTAVRAIVKHELTRAEAKSAKQGIAFDGAKIKLKREVAETLKNHPELVEARNQLAAADLKPAVTLEQREELGRLKEALARKEKELLVAAQPGLREFIEERERLQREVVESLARQKAPPEAMVAFFEELRARDETATKQK